MTVLVDHRRSVGRGRLVLLLLPIVLALAAWAHDWHFALDGDDCAALVVCGAALAVVVAVPLGRPGRRVCRRRAWRHWRRVANNRPLPARLCGRVALERLAPMLA